MNSVEEVKKKKHKVAASIKKYSFDYSISFFSKNADFILYMIDSCTALIY